MNWFTDQNWWVFFLSGLQQIVGLVQYHVAHTKICCVLVREITLKLGALSHVVHTKMGESKRCRCLTGKVPP